MPKLTCKLPSYRRHSNGRNAIVVLSGRTHVIGLYGSRASRREYDRLVGEWLQRGRTAEPQAANQESITMAELMAGYLRYAKSYYVKNGETTNEYDHFLVVCRLLKETHVDIPANEFGPVALKMIRQKMIEKGWSRPTINRQVRRITRMFRWASSNELVPVTVHQSLATVAGLKKGRTEAPEPKRILPVSDEIVDATLPHLSPIVADMVRFQRLTGCRPGEVCILRPMDIDRGGDVWEYHPESHKTEHHHRERVIPIGPKCQDIIRPYLLRPADSYCFSPSEADKLRRQELHSNRKTPISCGNKPGSNKKTKPRKTPGVRYDTKSYAGAIKYACRKAGVEHWAPNRLRHAAATTIRKEFGLEAAQVVLGHADANTSQIYAEKDLQLAVEVARKLG